MFQLHGQYPFTFYAQSFTHISLNVENHRNGKDNSDDNYVKNKDDPEKIKKKKDFNLMYNSLIFYCQSIHR